MNKGIIIRGISGFYYVKQNNTIIECKAKGRFRKDMISPIVGDEVVFDLNNDKTGIIKEILPRKSMMIRPSVANINQINIVCSIKNPDISLYILDKLIVLAEFNKINPIICINKCDLESEEKIDEIVKTYSSIGYAVVKICTKTGYGIDKLKDLIRNKISAFAGPSGAGKSSIINKLQSNVRMETGDISTKIQRGKNTTRHAELIDFDDNTFIVDTPGFTSIDISSIPKEKLQLCFKEFNNYLGKCRFTSCIHDKEIDCKIKEKVNDKTISKTRYESYINMLNEIKRCQGDYK